MPTTIEPPTLTNTRVERRLRSIEAQIASLQRIRGGTGIRVRHSKFGGISISDDRHTPLSFIGKIVNQGPAGEADYSADPRYWVNEAVVMNRGGSGRAPVQLQSKVETERADTKFWVTATNIAELDPSGNAGTHSVPLGSWVRVWEVTSQAGLSGLATSWEDQTAGDRKNRSGKRMWVFDRSLGGVGTLTPAVVTARYGAFVTVSELASVGLHPVPKINPTVTHTWVWAQSPFHIWIKKPVPDLGDVVMIGQLPQPMDVLDRYEIDAQGTQLGSGQTVQVTRFVLGTVPEADLNLLNGVDPGCVYSPFDTGCTLLPVNEDPRPPVP